MKLRILLAVLVFNLFSCQNTSKKPDLLSPGISKELADFRKEQLSEIVYNLDFAIPEKLKPILKNLIGLEQMLTNLQIVETLFGEQKN